MLKGQFLPAQPWELGSAVDYLVRSLDGADSTTTVAGIRSATKALNGQRHFHHCQRLGEAWYMRFGLDPTISKHQAQALINLSALDAAERLLNEGLARARTDGASAQARSEIPEYEGLLGRVQKQRFVMHGGADQLVAATDCYLKQYNEHPSRPYWQGINAVALMYSEQRSKIQARSPDAQALAKRIYDDVLARHEEDSSDPWLSATLSEASLALGNCDDAELWLYRFLHHPNTNPFAVDSFDRQLREIWQGSALGAGPKCASRLATIVAHHLMRTESRFSLSMPDAKALTESTGAQQRWLEKNFSGEHGFSLDTLKTMVSVCGSIGCVTNRTGERLGTGFLISGKDINQAWGDAPVFVTNAHVISDSVDGAIPASDVLVTFEVEAAAAGVPTFYPVADVLFTSAPGLLGVRCATDDDLDVTVVRLAVPEGKNNGSVLKTAARLPLVGPKTKTYVVGHPQGGGLQISLHDSLLLDIDQEGRLVHYRTPTEPGSSGSPVFNSGWEVIALHHGGSTNTPRLNGEGCYEANEGISLSAIRRKAGGKA